LQEPQSERLIIGAPSKYKDRVLRDPPMEDQLLIGTKASENAERVYENCSRLIEKNKLN
jgi:hypothetical protein